MNIEHVEKSYQELESDSTLQNLIARKPPIKYPYKKESL